jgi:hypothetical protein
MFLSDAIRVPQEWNSSKPFRLSPPRSEYPLYGRMEVIKPHTEMIERPEATDGFTRAVKTVLSVPKSALPNPFKKTALNRKSTAVRKES